MRLSRKKSLLKKVKEKPSVKKDQLVVSLLQEKKIRRVIETHRRQRKARTQTQDRQERQKRLPRRNQNPNRLNLIMKKKTKRIKKQKGMNRSNKLKNMEFSLMNC